MTNTEILINRIAQDRIEFHEGCDLLLDDTQFNFDELFVILRNYIFNSIPEKTSYSTEAYQNAVQTIPSLAPEPTEGSCEANVSGD